MRTARLLLAGLAAGVLAGGARAQEIPSTPDSARAPRASRRARPTALFRSDSVLTVTIRTDIRGLFGDRDTSDVAWREGTITWPGPDGARTVPLRLRTRGMYRLRECEIPPIRLRFTDSLVRGTVWENARRPKLVSPCFNRDNYEQLVLKEYAIYRVLRLFTPMGFAARLLRVTYEDERGRGRAITRYAFVTEDPERFVERVGGELIDPEVGRPFVPLSPEMIALLGVFQYFIGNPDWSFAGHHNIELVRVADTTYGIPYDFDWSGVVDAPYARPAPQLPIQNVRERYYLGFCQPETVVEPVVARFETMRDSVAAVVRAVPGLQPRTAERTLAYLDGFYRAVADRERFFQRTVARECRP